MLTSTSGWKKKNIFVLLIGLVSLLAKVLGPDFKFIGYNLSGFILYLKRIRRKIIKKCKELPDNYVAYMRVFDDLLDFSLQERRIYLWRQNENAEAPGETYRFLKPV